MSGRSGRLSLINARVVTCESRSDDPYGLVPELSALCINNGLIDQVVPMSGLPCSVEGECVDLGGKLVTPGLIDCHTHLVFAGDRSAEWDMRLRGRSYQDIARAGGGIISTVNATRAASEDELFDLARSRLISLAKEGVTCVEIKSGYGLTLVDELKLLRVVKRLRNERIAEISATLLAAHTVPPEFKGNPDGYVRLIEEEILPHVAEQGLAEAVDVFCEPIAFSLSQCERIFAAASRHGLAVKAHAEQLSYSGCALMAASHKAWSVDHLEYLAEVDAERLAATTTVATLLPGAFYALKETKVPPIQALRRAGVPMAVATDCNPGTSPFTSLRMMMNLACVLFGMTPAEAFLGVTRHAAQALGRDDRLGTISPGKEATVCVWDVHNPVSLVSDLSRNPLSSVYVRGEARHV